MKIVLITYQIFYPNGHHGFDFYDCKYDNLHYFEDKNAPHGLNKFKFNNSKDHTPQTEKTYIKHITEKYNIKFL